MGGGRLRSWSRGTGFGLKGKKRSEEEKEKGFFSNFQNPVKQLNSNKDLNSNTRNNAPACMQQ
jgi:hypothetical protein